MEVGVRCEVEGGRRGMVRYIGRCEGLPKGWWVGVQVSLGAVPAAVGLHAACCCCCCCPHRFPPVKRSAVHSMPATNKRVLRGGCLTYSLFILVLQLTLLSALCLL